MAGNDTVMAKCEFHCAHAAGKERWDNSSGTNGNIRVFCCWCTKHIWVTFTVELLPLPGHGCYSREKTRVYDWPQGWGIQEFAPNLPTNV